MTKHCQNCIHRKLAYKTPKIGVCQKLLSDVGKLGTMYGKNGNKADTVLMQENWELKKGKVVAGVQYPARNSKAMNG